MNKEVSSLAPPYTRAVTADATPAPASWSGRRRTARSRHFYDDRGVNIDAQILVAITALVDDLTGRRPPPVEQDGRDLEARQMLAAYYRRLWRRASDLQDPTWWQRHAPHDPEEDT